jgi:uncharacterized protein
VGTIDERTGLESLSEAMCWELLRAGRVARMAVVVGGRPDIFPVNYTVEQGMILIRTAPGTKLAAAVLAGHVALEVDDIDVELREGWSVVVHGTASEVERLDDLLDAEETGLEAWADAPKNRWLRVEADSVTGRRIAR